MKLVIDTKETINKVVADEFIKVINSKEHPVIGLATGSTPLGVYAELAKAVKEARVSFKKVHSFNLDEYVGLPVTNDQSYRYFMNYNLFQHVDIDVNNTKVPTPETYEVYDDMIAKEGGIDIQILGLGSDGHIAFNEPGTPFDSLTHLADLQESTIKDNSRFFASIDDVPTKAMTMGLKSIMNARKIVLIAYGKNKAEAVNAMFNGPIDESMPASILRNHNDVTIYCDADAASLLK
ncbi:MAG: glucosamine-6-phosphate deaminase [Bacilli bacterium]|nr:glucosamine-6-phosphate deaminase [Bacilli bacterium]